jgi:hypothetical protein
LFLRSSFLASIGLLLSSLLLFSCGGSEGDSEPPDNSQEEASQSESQGPVRGEVGETLSTGAVSVTLNSYDLQIADYGDGEPLEYVVPNLTFESEDQSFQVDASFNLALYDESGYTYDQEPLMDYSDPPSGTLSPGGRPVSGEVGFQLHDGEGLGPDYELEVYDLGPRRVIFEIPTQELEAGGGGSTSGESTGSLSVQETTTTIE